LVGCFDEDLFVALVSDFGFVDLKGVDGLRASVCVCHAGRNTIHADAEVADLESDTLDEHMDHSVSSARDGG